MCIRDRGDTITAVYSEREKEVTFEKMNMTADSSVQKEKLTENVIDGKGAYAIPGLIDLHFHGCMGDDFCDGDKEAKMCIRDSRSRDAEPGS